jgi:hypothetical protein
VVDAGHLQIATAKQPGYFKYYKAPEVASKVEHKHVLSEKSKRLADLQARIDSKEAELSKAREEASKAPPAPDVPDLKRWFDRYRRPDPTFGGPGATTSFSASARVFGGTKHYPAFRSVVTDMKRGRMLR